MVYPQRGGGSSELFSTCHLWNPPYSGYVSVPKNPGGFQFPKLGGNYAGITCYVNSESREYIETKLSRVLDPGVNYYVEFWVSLANESNYAVENIGAYFSTDTLHYSSNITTLIDAQVEHSGGIITDTMNWVKVSGYFKPNKDGYQFLTIGNFQPSDSTNKTLVGWHAYEGAYYYIENVVVIDSALQHTIGIKETVTEPVEVKVYPNPACGIVNIEFSNRFDSEFEIQIFDIIGRKRYVKSFAFSKNLELDISELESGMYFIRIIGKGGSHISQKLIIE